MKICIITDAWKPVWGGGQEHIWQVSQRLAQTGQFDITILAPNFGPENEYYKNLRILRIGPKFTFPNPLGRILYLISNLKFQISNSFDIVNIQSHDTLFLVPLIHLFKPKSKLVLTLHGQAITPLRPIWEKLVFDFPFDALLTAAKSTVTRKVAAKKLVVIGNGVNIADFDKVKNQKPKIFTVVWVGRPSDPVKGVNYLKDAVKQIPHVKLDLVSNVSHQEVIKRLKHSSLFVLPSLSEGLPLVLLEAMAAKLPVVATDVGDCKEILEKSGGGIVVPKGSSEALATGIKFFYQTKKRDTGYNYVKKHYTWDNIAKTYLSVYKNS